MTDFVINESTVNCWWYNPEVHQSCHWTFSRFYRDSGKGKTPLASCLAAMVARDAGLDEFVMVSSPDMLRSAVERSLLRDERPLLLDELQISSSNIGAQGGGVDTLKHLLGLSPDLPATIKCRYNDVKVPAETFRIITVQDLAKLHHNLDDMAKIRPPDLMLEGFEWRARPLDKVFDADTRAVLKRSVSRTLCARSESSGPTRQSPWRRV